MLVFVLNTATVFGEPLLPAFVHPSMVTPKLSVKGGNAEVTPIVNGPPAPRLKLIMSLAPQFPLALRMACRNEPGPASAVVVTVYVADIPAGFMIRLTPLSDPVFKGLEPTTRTLYPAPLGVVSGIVALIVPDAVVAAEPIFVGDANEPEASES